MKIDLFNPVSYNDFLTISSEKKDSLSIISLRNNYTVEKVNNFLIKELDRENDDRSFLNVNYPVFIIRADFVVKNFNLDEFLSLKATERLKKFSEKFIWIKDIYSEVGWDVDFRMMLNNPCFIFSEKNINKKEELNSEIKDRVASRFKLMEI